jgi:hypothetical protein
MALKRINKELMDLGRYGCLSLVKLRHRCPTCLAEGGVKR